MVALIASLISGITEGLKLANTKSSRKYIDKLFEIREELIKEEARGYEVDDTHIEQLYKKLKITIEAANNEISLANAKSN